MNTFGLQKTDMQISCHTFQCFERAAYFLGRPDSPRGTEYYVCEKCAGELVHNILESRVPEGTAIVGPKAFAAVNISAATLDKLGAESITAESVSIAESDKITSGTIDAGSKGQIMSYLEKNPNPVDMLLGKPVSEWTMPELHEKAKELDITVPSKILKKDLVKVIEGAVR